VVYSWDFRNRLAEVQTYTVSGASSTLVQTIDFGYDAFDHRTRETVTNNTASSVIFDQRFIYDGTNIAAAVDATTLTIQQAFLHGLAQNEFYAQDNVGTSSTMTLWAITDHQPYFGHSDNPENLLISSPGPDAYPSTPAVPGFTTTTRGGM
jgi:hypothetical protein